MSTTTSAPTTAPPDIGVPAERPPRSRGAGGLPYALALPAAFLLALSLGYPLVRQVVLSFHEYGLAQQFGRPADFVGLDNYEALVTDSYLWKVLVRTIVFCLVNAAVTMVLGMAVALLMRLMSGPVRVLVQAGLLLAWAMPVVASLTVWQWLFDTQYGVVNWTLTRLGADYEGHAWLLEPLSFFFVATVIVVWMSVPFVAFTGYAALTQVSEDLTEAAELDGAGAWQRLRHVVLPAIRPVLLIMGLLQIIWDLRVFTQIYVLQQAGGVTRDTNLLGTYIYRLGIGGGDFGTAAAVAMFMLALTVILTAPYVVTMLRAEED
ncbi:MAG TPA: sugar ABC transporter permease [Nocardioides sp.]|uniref:carbohydrate ABC transporter permease n=1 Tax=Nocardioides sp. TaxID=35761 RepID=UPI002E377312|nr:sugar ABC transporter permease [Nocardioides sp.]HEX5090773.1 sugar ABC transporter permease [Nocardioides sp.]